MAQVAIVGGGPAGLIAAEVLGGAGHGVTVFDRMASPARKFLLAGRGGLNLTHSESADLFLGRYDAAGAWLASCLAAFSPLDLRHWCEGLGEPVFVGSSGRVFPKSLKAAPLLRAWLRRLGELGVRFAPRHRWLGFGAGRELRFQTPVGSVLARPDAVLLALGGASWPRMGSDGAWVEVLHGVGVEVRGLRPSNCGVDVAWSPVFVGRFEGAPLKRIALVAGGRRVRGEAVVTRNGVEGGAVYALSAAMREALAAGEGPVWLEVDLLPDLSLEAALGRLDGARQGRSLSGFLRQRVGLAPVGVGLVQEALHAGFSAACLGRLVKAVPLAVTGIQPIGRAISSAGGIVRGAFDERFMLTALPGVLLDWEAPTGGYLLQACFSTGVWAARGVVDWLREGGEARAAKLTDPVLN